MATFDVLPVFRLSVWIGCALALQPLPAVEIEGPSLEGNVIVAVGTDGSRVQSDDATQWQALPVAGRYFQPGPPPDQFEGFPGHDNTLYALAAEETGFVAVGNYGNVIVRTLDGEEWRSLYETNELALCRDVAVGNGVTLVAGWRNSVGNVVGKLDENGGWRFVEIPEEYKKPAPLRSLTFGNGRFVLVSDDGAIGVTRDGEEWLHVREATGSTRDRFRVHHGDGQFLLLGESLSLVSDHGEKWRKIDLPGRLPNGQVPATWTGKGFVIVNPEAEEIYWSTDAEQWDRLDADGDLPKQSALLAVGDALFGLDYGLRIVSSKDGTSWQTLYDGSEAGDFSLQFHDLELGRIQGVAEEPMPLGALREWW